MVVAPEDADAFIAAAQEENLEAYRVALVTEEARMVMSWKGHEIANLSRDFLNTNGAVKHAGVEVPDGNRPFGLVYDDPIDLRALAGQLKFASQRGLVERFDATIGAGSLLMPFGGKNQATPAQAMAAKLPVLPGEDTDAASVMAWGCDPDLLSADPYLGAKAAVISSMAKIVAAGADYKKAYLTLQEFFEKLRNEPQRWGKPFQALLGALDAQLHLDAAAIGGKDSMSGTFLDKDVPPTLISFAIAPLKASEVISGEFKEAGHPVYFFDCGSYDAMKTTWEKFHGLCLAGKVKAAYAVDAGGVAEAVMKMSFGNDIGFAETEGAVRYDGPRYGCLIAELTEDCDFGEKIGVTTAEPVIRYHGDTASIAELYAINASVLEKVYPTKTVETDKTIPTFDYQASTYPAPAVKCAKPKVLIPVFPGTNCEYDSARAVEAAGAQADILVIRNLTAEDVARSVEQAVGKIRDSQMIFLPGGFSGGDEPDGSAKFITAFFRNPAVKEQVMKLLNDRDGLMCGICNGFQALIKLGLVPYGKIIDTDDTCPTLTFNTIGRHQSRIVRTRVASNKSPWLSLTQVGDVYNVPISHGEGKFLASQALVKQLAENGQIATQYVDLAGNPTMDAAFNPNGSVCAIEGITSPDGRVFGKMGHSERIGKALYRNVPGQYDIRMFEAAVKYFK